jgi:hypothetical protein
MSENWREERDRIVRLLAAVRSGNVTHVDQRDMRELQATNPVNVAALEARLKQCTSGWTTFRGWAAAPEFAA